MVQIGEDESCIDGDPRIIAVHILDGSNDVYVVRDRYQYVNFPKDAKWVNAEAGLRNEDRLGQKLRIKVEFDQPGAHNFTLKLVPSESNVVYSGAEEGRNPNFLYQKEEKSYTTDGDGTKIIEDEFFFVTCAGSDVYAVEATDDCDNTVSSLEIEVKRLFYTVEMKMKGAACAQSIRPVEAVFEGHGIKVECLPSVEMEQMENVGTKAELAELLSNARAAYAESDGPDKQPYVLAIAYTGHLAEKGSDRTVKSQPGVAVGPNASPVTVEVIDGNQHPHLLWKGIVAGEGWFRSARFISETGAVVSIGKENCIAVPWGGPTKDSHRQIIVDVSGMPEDTGQIEIDVDWIEKMRGGTAFRDSNLVAVSTRAYWLPVPDNKQHEIIVHELAHRLGMVVDGTGKLPDKTKYYYPTTENHRGPHCHNGVKVAPRMPSAKNAKCVMYGAVSGNISFCSECEPAVKKLDLSEGWKPI